MIKFEHSIFALPFALTAALLAARTVHATTGGPAWPTWQQIAWIVVAMVGARSFAMTINRIADLRYDAENPRTKSRVSHRRAHSSIRMGIHNLRRSVASRCRVEIKSSRARTFPRRARRAFILFLHKTIHFVVAHRSGILFGNFSRSSVDRHRRFARSAHVNSLRGRHIVGWRI